MNFEETIFNNHLDASHY